MHAQKNDLCICFDDDWTHTSYQRVRDLRKKEIKIGPLEDLLDSTTGRHFTDDIAKHVFLSPFTLRTLREHSSRHHIADQILDLASNLLRASGHLPVETLLTTITADQRLKDIPASFIEGCLRCGVAGRSLVAVRRGRQKAKAVHLELSAAQLQKEAARTMAGTLASELVQLSQRIRSLVQHGPTVGSYRENLLQTLLRKHLPERYHVATGFIYHCNRQLDIVIYDRIDYAPVFREGDLVVVHPESVRAVIEVKTSLNTAALKDSLQLLADVCPFDDRDPPFFKGIFAFGSRMSAKSMETAIADFYITDDEAPFDIVTENSIGQPFDHMTALCVLEKLYTEVEYQAMDDDRRLVPSLFSYTSGTGLKPQATHFVEKLLAYLRTDGLKEHDVRGMTQILGMDTQVKKVKELTGASWGGYFADDEDIGDGNEGAEMAARIVAVQQWLAGGRYPRA